MSKRVKVSIIVPTYKRDDKFLDRAINSLLSQTYQDIEIIVVDDNPPDSDFRNKICNFMMKYSENNKILYLKNQKNVGGSISRNNGIKNSSGDFVTFLDDDDEYLPKKIEKQVNFMIENSLDMSFTNLKLVNDDKIVIDYREYSSLKSFDKSTLLKYHLLKHLTGTPTFMYKKSKLLEIGLFDDAKMGQEFYLMLKSIENNLKIGYLDTCEVIAYRHNEGGISQGLNKINGENALYNFKIKYFHILNFSEKMYIKFRHYAVLTIAYRKNKQYIMAIITAFRMILSSPLDFTMEVINFMYKLLKQNINRGQI